jgi:hypothetical protein
VKTNRKLLLAAWGVLATVVLLTTFIFGCGCDPHAGKYTTTSPTPQLLVGDWKLKAGSFAINATKPTKLTLRADGSFTAVNYPGAAVGSFGTPGSFLDGDGNWSVQQHQSFWVVGITWQNLGGKQLDYGQMLHIQNDAAPHVLRHFIGDPDSGEALVFKKASATSPK